MTLFERAVQSTASTLRVNGESLTSAQITQLTEFLRLQHQEFRGHQKSSGDTILISASASPL